MTTKIRKSLDERDQGFTLIELLVVIIIIGILAAIAIPVFLNQRKKGVDAGLKSDLKNAATTVEAWNTDNPTNAVPAGTTATGGTASAALADFKPSTGNTIQVKPGTDVGSYILCAFNTGASAATTSGNAMLYNSATGGLVSAPGAC